MQHTVRILILALVAFTLIAPVQARAQAQRAQLEEFGELELSAMMPSPADLADFGLEGYAPRFSWTDVLDSEFTNILAGNGLTAQEIHELLQAPGLVRSRGLRLDLAAEDNPAEAARSITFWIDEFQRADGLEDVLAMYLNFGDAESLELTEEVGDQSLAIRYEDLATDTEVAATSIALAFSLDNLVGQVAVTDFTTVQPDDGPTLTEIETLAGMLLERMENGLDEPGPGLEHLMLRLETDGETAYYGGDYYYRIDGDSLPLFGEAADNMRDRDQISDESDIDSAYGVDQTIVDATESGFRWNSRIRQFESAEAAAAELANVPAQLEELAPDADVTVLDDAPELGDDALAVTMDYDDGAFGYTSIYVVVDDYLLSADLGHEGEAPPLEVVAELAEAHAGCVAEGVCDLEYPVPVSLTELAGG